MTKYKFIISGGGTGGHIFPAIAIANALRAKSPDAEILFVGALGRMEMEKVPAAGYSILGLPISGFDRKRLYNNFLVLAKLIKSIVQARRIVKEFSPNVAIGVGGYASGPLLFAATRMGVPSLIQEQNSYAGVTNRLLAKRAKKICVAFPGMERYFPQDKIVLTGNPVRQDIQSSLLSKQEALEFFKLRNDIQTVLIIGGSLGAGTINKSLIAGLDKLINAGVQVIWQTGKYYHQNITDNLKDKNTIGVRVFDFISRMDMAYAAADIVISRAGAIAISELCLVAKPVILVPSPNVAEDHQTKNALTLVSNNAAIVVADKEAEVNLVDETLRLLNNLNKRNELKINISKMAFRDSASVIADEIFKLLD